MSRLPRAIAIRDDSEGWGFFRCTRKEVRQTRSGGSIVSLLLQDASGDIAARILSPAEAQRADYEVGEFVRVQGRGRRYQQRLELVLDAIRRVDPDRDGADGFREEDCIASAPRPLDEMWAELRARVDAAGNPWIRQLLSAVLDRHGERLRVWPAAVTVHHAYRGGLLEHILSIASVGDACAAHYGIDRDLLLAGAVLHDIGKLDELSCEGGATAYTRDGNLLGHITLGLTLVREAAAGIPGFPAELRARIEHLIASHHGARELGSPVEPMTEEAFVLSAIDDLDAQLHQVRRQLDAAAGGDFTPYHPRLKRVLFRPSGR